MGFTLDAVALAVNGSLSKTVSPFAGSWTVMTG
jgi:hypothetical protein